MAPRILVQRALSAEYLSSVQCPRSRSLLWRSADWLWPPAGRLRRRRRRNASGRRGFFKIVDDAADRVSGIGMHVFRRGRRAIRQMVERVELRWRNGLELEIAFGQGLDAVGIVELSPLRAQCGDVVAFVTHLAAQFGELLGL